MFHTNLDTRSSRDFFRRLRADDIIDLALLTRILWSGRWIILFFSVLAFCLSLLFSSVFSASHYDATVTIARDMDGGFYAQMSSLTADTSARLELNTEIEIFYARPLLLQVVDDLDLTADPEFTELGLFPFVSDMANRFATVTGMQPRTIFTSEDARLTAANILRQKLFVRNIPDSYVFEIRVTADDRMSALKIAEALVQVYMADQSQKLKDSADIAASALQDQIADIQRELQTAQENLSLFAERTGFSDDLYMQSDLIRLKGFRRLIAEREAILNKGTKRLELMNITSDRDDLAIALEDDELLRMRADAPDDTDAFDERIELLRLIALHNIETSSHILTTLRTTEAKLTADVGQNTDDFAELQQLTRDIEIRKLLLSTLVSRIQTLQSLTSLDARQSQILSQPQIPTSASGAGPAMVAVIAAIFGGLVGLLVTLFMARRSQATFNSAKELELEFQTPVLATFPSATGASPGAASDVRMALVAREDLKHARVILFTSAVSNENSDGTAVSLAAALARQNLSVVVLLADPESDVPSPVSARLGDASGAETLTGAQQDLAHLIRKDSATGIHFADGTTHPATSDEILLSDPWYSAIAALRSAFDYVLIAAPPVLSAPQAKLLHTCAEATFVSVRANHTPVDVVHDALRALPQKPNDRRMFILTGWHEHTSLLARPRWTKLGGRLRHAE